MRCSFVSEEFCNTVDVLHGFSQRWVDYVCIMCACGTVNEQVAPLKKKKDGVADNQP